MKQISRCGRAIALSVGSRGASYASGYAPWMNTPPSRRFLMQSICPTSSSARQDLTLQRTCGSSVSPALWVILFLVSRTVQCFNRQILKGMAHASTFSRSTTHLLCPAAMGAKYARARMWGTPVVDMRWLFHIARTGALPPPGIFLVPDSHTRSAETTNAVKCTRMAFFVANIVLISPPGSEVARPGGREDGHVTSARAVRTHATAGSFTIRGGLGRPRAILRSVHVACWPGRSCPEFLADASSRLEPFGYAVFPLCLALCASRPYPILPFLGKALAPGSDTEDDDASPRVPSSNTPSPLKLSVDQTDPAARALHDSISNLLGKRSAGGMLIEEQPEPPTRRKRARPRSKVSPTSLCAFRFHFSLIITCLRCFISHFAAASHFSGGHHRCECQRGHL
jgi:twin BRCT domain